MHRTLRITPDPIDEAAWSRDRRQSGTAGAVITFLGVVRGEEGGANIRGLAYECFNPMAERQFELLFDEVERRWPVESIRLVHRTGAVLAGEASLWVEVSAPHRGEAFAACQWIIDRMKEVVPIWKQPLS